MASRGKRSKREGPPGQSFAPSSASPAAAAADRDEAAAAAAHVGQLYGHIYAVVRAIPRGRVATYGQVAELADVPRAARLVGTAMRVSVPELGLPWHRVVGKRSATSARVSIHDPVGAGIQRALLEEEGVEVSAAGGISLARFGWLTLDR